MQSLAHLAGWLRFIWRFELLYYECAPTRGAEVIERMLDGFQGFMQTDGYAGYDAVGNETGIVHVGCFVHARRKFD